MIFIDAILTVPSFSTPVKYWHFTMSNGEIITRWGYYDPSKEPPNFTEKGNGWMQKTLVQKKLLIELWRKKE